MHSGRIHIPARTAVNHHDLAHIAFILGLYLSPGIPSTVFLSTIKDNHYSWDSPERVIILCYFCPSPFPFIIEYTSILPQRLRRAVDEIRSPTPPALERVLWHVAWDCGAKSPRCSTTPAPYWPPRHASRRSECRNGSSLSLNHLKADNGDNERKSKEQSPESRRFPKDQDAQQHRSQSADSRPYGIGRTDGDGLNGLGQQHHT